MPFTVAEAMVGSFQENSIAKRRTRKYFGVVNLGLPAQGFTLALLLFLSEYWTRDLNEMSDMAIPQPSIGERRNTECFLIHEGKPGRRKILPMSDELAQKTSKLFQGLFITRWRPVWEGD